MIGYGSGGSPPLGNGCYTEYDYDDARRFIKLTNKKSNETVISSWEYDYNDVGYVTKRTDKDSNEISYTYDDVHRLTEVDYPSGSDYIYEYDSVGNRTKSYEVTSSSTITTTYTYDDANQLTRWTTSTVTMTFTYASDGCLVTKSDGTDTWTYDWDYERRLEAFKKNSATLVEYAYNPTGTRRYSSDSTLGLTNYFYSRNHVLADYNSNWSLTKSYIMGPKVDEIIAMIDRTTDPNTSNYFTRDRLGSTRELVNTSEAVNTRYGYDAWGDPTETKLLGSVESRFLYARLVWDGHDVYLKEKPWSPGLARAIRPRNIPGPDIILGDTNLYLTDLKPICEDDYWKCMAGCDMYCDTEPGASGGGGWCQACCGFRKQVCESSHMRLRSGQWTSTCWDDCCSHWPIPVRSDGSAITCQWEFENENECWCFYDGLLWSGHYDGRYCKYCIYTCFDLRTGEKRDAQSNIYWTYHIASGTGSCPLIVPCGHNADECSDPWAHQPVVKVWSQFIERYLLDHLGN